MSKTRFTKGKWSVGTGKLEGGVVDETNELICDPSGGRFEDEAKANAALISAAPDMYAMLEELYDNLNRGMKYIISRRVKNGCPIDLARKCSASNIELARRIKALLKKARGENDKI